MRSHRLDYVTAQRDYDEKDDPSLGDDGSDFDATTADDSDEWNDDVEDDDTEN